MAKGGLLHRLLNRKANSSIKNDIYDDRSSTASHYSSSFGTVTAGIQESNDFYGIPITNDIIGITNDETFYYLCILLVVLAFKPYYMKNASISLEVSYWIGVGSVLYVLKEVTIYPLLSNIIYTRTSYPYLIVISHCLSAVCSFRKQQEQEQQSRNNNQKKSHLYNMGLSFLCYGFGGSIVSDLFLGLPITALTHARIVPCFIVCYGIIYFSPYDIVYTLLTSDNNNSPMRLFIVTICETIDAVTTPMGRVSRAARELHNKVTAPIVAGVLAGIGGAVLRYTILEGSSSFKAIEHGFYKNISISIVWWYMVVWSCSSLIDEDDDFEGSYNNENCNPSYNGSDVLRVSIVGFHIVWNLISEFWGSTINHPIIDIIENIILYPIHTYIVPTLRLGPQSS